MRVMFDQRADELPHPPLVERDGATLGLFSIQCGPPLPIASAVSRFFHLTVGLRCHEWAKIRACHRFVTGRGWIPAGF